MAFIDKCTTMRRCALIFREGNGNIEYEGVNIEGTLVLKEVTTGAILVTKVEDFNDNWRWKDNYTLVYQDPKGEDMWVPRESCTNHDGKWYYENLLPKVYKAKVRRLKDD